MKRIFKFSLRLVLALFVFLNVVMAFNAWKFTHFYDDPLLRQPQKAGFFASLGNVVFGVKIPKRLNDKLPAAPYTTTKITTADGFILEAWEIDAPKDSGLNPVAPRGTVILFHGHGSCKSAILAEQESFRTLGYNTMLVDFRAHGNSTGEQCTVGIKETADIKAAYDVVAKKGEKNIILYGISMGSATILAAMHQYADITPAKVILEMPFGTLKDAVHGKLQMMGLPRYPFVPLLTFYGGVLNGEWAFSYEPEVFAQSLSCPVLLQWGRKDPRVSQRETDAIFSNLRMANKQLVVFEAAGHESLCKNDHKKWMASVSGFLLP